MPSRLPSRLLAAAPPALLALAAACGGGGAARFAAPGEVPADVVGRDPASLRPVVVRDGVAYLFVRPSLPTGEDDQGVELPTCWMEGDQHCPRSVPVPAGVEVGLLPPTVAVLGVDGACTATVGAPALINTSGCEPSGMIAAPLTGCPTELAPIARVDGAFDPDLRWKPAPSVSTVPLFVEPGTLRDPVHRRAVEGWLAEDELRAGTPREGLTARVRADAGAEALESVVAGFLVGSGDDECEWSTGWRGVVGIRRGDQLTPLPEAPAEWDGVFTWRGRIAGIAAGSPRDVNVHAVGADATTALVYEASVWWDNEECTQGGWAHVEYPCGP